MILHLHSWTQQWVDYTSRDFVREGQSCTRGCFRVLTKNRVVVPSAAWRGRHLAAEAELRRTKGEQ